MIIAAYQSGDKIVQQIFPDITQGLEKLFFDVTKREYQNPDNVKSLWNCFQKDIYDCAKSEKQTILYYSRHLSLIYIP